MNNIDKHLNEINKLNIPTSLKYEIKELIKNELSDFLIQEQALYKSKIEQEMRCYANNLYYTLINICILEYTFPEMVQHWKHEIYTFTRPFIAPNLKSQTRNMDLVESVKKYMMEPTMGRKFEDYSADDFIAAMEYEIDKANIDCKYNDNKVRRLKEIEAIKELLKNPDDMIDIAFYQKRRIAYFYVNFLYAVETKQELDLMVAINSFIDNDPDYYEYDCEYEHK